MSPLRQADAVMLVDYKRVLAKEESPEALAECEWLS